MEDETYATNIVEYKPKGLNHEIRTKIGNSITALLITASLITCTYAIAHPDYEDNQEKEQIQKTENWFTLDRDKQFVTGVLIFEAGVLNNIYLKGETKRKKI